MVAATGSASSPSGLAGGYILENFQGAGVQRNADGGQGLAVRQLAALHAAQTQPLGSGAEQQREQLLRFAIGQGLLGEQQATDRQGCHCLALARVTAGRQGEGEGAWTAALQGGNGLRLQGQ